MTRSRHNTNVIKGVCTSLSVSQSSGVYGSMKLLLYNNRCRTGDQLPSKKPPARALSIACCREWRVDAFLTAHAGMIVPCHHIPHRRWSWRRLLRKPSRAGRTASRYVTVYRPGHQRHYGTTARLKYRNELSGLSSMVPRCPALRAAALIFMTSTFAKTVSRAVVCVYVTSAYASPPCSEDTRCAASVHTTAW